MFYYALSYVFYNTDLIRLLLIISLKLTCFCGLIFVFYNVDLIKLVDNIVSLKCFIPALTCSIYLPQSR